MNMVGRRLRNLGARDFLKANQRQANDDDREDGLYYSHSCPFLTHYMSFWGREFYSRAGAASSFSDEPLADLMSAGFIALPNTAI